MADYLKYGAITGESQAEGHKGSAGWIEVGELQWGCGRSIHSKVGASGKREASAPSVSEITLTKEMDSTSLKLAKEALVGKAVDAVIELVETGENQLNTFLTLKLVNCMISAFSFSGGGGRPTESLTLNFTKLDFLYTGYDDQHKIDNTKKATLIYDLTAAKSV